MRAWLPAVLAALPLALTAAYAAPAGAPMEQARPGDAEASRGLTAAMNGDYERAIAEFTSAIAKAPGEGDLYGMRGEVYREQKKYPQAIADLRRALSMRPDYADQISLGMSLAANKQLPEALAAFRAAVALEPDGPDAFEQMGVAQANNADYAGALESFTKALAAAPLEPRLHVLQGQTYEMLRRKPEAVTAYKKAVSIKPDHVPALIAIGRAEFNQGNLTASRDALLAATRTDPRSAVAFGLLGDTYDDMRDYPAAKAAYQTAVRLNPRDADSWAGLVYVLGKLNEPTTAALAELRKLDPGYAQEVLNGGNGHQDRMAPASSGAPTRSD